VAENGTARSVSTPAPPGKAFKPALKAVICWCCAVDGSMGNFMFLRALLGLMMTQTEQQSRASPFDSHANLCHTPGES